MPKKALVLKATSPFVILSAKQTPVLPCSGCTSHGLEYRMYKSEKVEPGHLTNNQVLFDVQAAQHSCQVSAGSDTISLCNSHPSKKQKSKTRQMGCLLAAAKATRMLGNIFALQLP
jgi:hypothetical protein